MKVTRIAYSRNLNAGKYAQLLEQACRLGRVRSLVWDLRGSISGLCVSDRAIRDAWMAGGTAAGFGVLANAWKETVRDAAADIRAHREAAKVGVRRRIHRRQMPEIERKRLYTLLLITLPRSTSWIEMPIPTSACTHLTPGCGRSSRNGLIAIGPGLRHRRPVPVRRAKHPDQRSPLIKE